MVVSGLWLSVALWRTPGISCRRRRAASEQLTVLVRALRASRKRIAKRIAAQYEQIDLIDRLLKIVANGNYAGEPGRTATQNANRFYNTLRRFGITKAALGVTAHGLRHQHANDRYEELTGEPSPVRGGNGEAPNKRAARLAIAHELGHGRTEVSNAYLGQSASTRARKQDEPDAAEPAAAV